MEDAHRAHILGLEDCQAPPKGRRARRVSAGSLYPGLYRTFLIGLYSFWDVQEFFGLCGLLFFEVVWALSIWVWSLTPVWVAQP